MAKPTLNEVSLSSVTEADFDFIYDLKCEEKSIIWGGFAAKPDYEKLKLHYERRMSDRSKITLIVWWNEKKVGLISFTIPDGANCEDFSINVSEKFSGFGLGRLALGETINYLIKNFPRCEKVIVWIREDNTPSQIIFRASGFIESEICQERYLASDRKPCCYRAWSRPLGIWEDIFANQPWGKYPGEDLIRFISRNFYGVPNRRQVKILEIGCGPGANLWYLAREGFRFVGIDGSPTAIAQASRRLDEECPGWREHSELHVGDVNNLPFVDESFDAAIDNECVCCNTLDMSRRIYDEVHRVLRIGAPMYVRTFASGCWGEGTGKSAGKNAWICDEGPLAGLGLARFTALDDIPILLERFELLTVELISRSANNRHNLVTEWIINSRKRKV